MNVCWAGGFRSSVHDASHHCLSPQAGSLVCMWQRIWPKHRSSWAAPAARGAASGPLTVSALQTTERALPAWQHSSSQVGKDWRGDAGGEH